MIFHRTEAGSGLSPLYQPVSLAVRKLLKAEVKSFVQGWLG